MDTSVLGLLLGVVFVVLLLAGRKRLAAGANEQVANGAVLLVLAVLAGAVALAVVASLDFW